MKKILVAIIAALPLAGCNNTYSYGRVDSVNASVPTRAAVAPDRVAILESDASRPYDSLGDVDVTVNKWSLLSKDPTRADVDAALREKASALGADAVVMVRYGSVGITPLSWGSLDGKGRAVAYRK